MEVTLPIFKIKLLIYQYKADLDVNLFFGENVCLIDLEITKMLVKRSYVNENRRLRQR